MSRSSAPRGPRRLADGAGRGVGRWLAACLVGALALGGCTSARANLGTSDSPCFVALPAAAAAVHHTGRLVGVRLRTVGSLRGARGVHEVLVAAHDTQGQRVCLVAFSGDYHRADVARPAGRQAGHLAVVVLSYPASTVEGTVILIRAPLEFGHSRLGPS